MAKIAVISDIHSNLHALYAVMADFQSMQCGSVVCLGDVVGYNAYPQECVNEIRALGCPVVKGNHDAEVVHFAQLLKDPAQGSEFAIRMNPLARKAMEWNASRLDEDSLTWLRRLPLQRIERSKFAMVHSCLDQPMAWNYILNANDATGNFQRQFLPLCFHGHTHQPRVFTWDGRHASEHAEYWQQLVVEGETVVNLELGRKYFINVGSVGQPRDGDPRACYAIYDSDVATVTLRRVEYDVAGAQQAVLSVGLPEYLAERLGTGQ
ncbi:MAG: metallophosphoesterase family protein [Akkermansia sp.]|nr:metallophosphoesterase family protein [Akkermansia sp.]